MLISFERKEVVCESSLNVLFNFQLIDVFGKSCCIRVFELLSSLDEFGPSCLIFFRCHTSLEWFEVNTCIYLTSMSVKSLPVSDKSRRKHMREASSDGDVTIPLQLRRSEKKFTL